MNVDALETPAVVVDLDILEANLTRVTQYAREHGLAVRPHTKTHKIPAIARLQIESGCRGLTVAKSTEAEVMARAGFDDLLVAYPIVVAEKAKRLAGLAGTKRILVAVDSLLAAEILSAAAAAVGSTVHLLVELDVGMRRCGVATPEGVLLLAQAIDRLPHARFAGLNFYPGHIHAAPGEQSEPLAEVAGKLQDVLTRLSGSGLEAEIVSGGSTPTLFQSHRIPQLTEIRPGTYVFNDRNTIDARACSLADCALRVLVTVISNAVPGRAMIDGGSKTFSSDRFVQGGDGYGYIVEEPGVLFEAMSEEHGHLSLSSTDRELQVGERLSIIPNHVCPCVNLHDRIWFHRKGVVEGSWDVAGRGKIR